jgi:hypothetical protein
MEDDVGQAGSLQKVGKPLCCFALLIVEKKSKRSRKTLEGDIGDAPNTQKVGKPLRYFALLNPFNLERKKIAEERRG